MLKIKEIRYFIEKLHNVQLLSPQCVVQTVHFSILQNAKIPKNFHVDVYTHMAVRRLDLS